MTRSTRITIETDSLLIFRGRTSARSWCAGCAEEVEMVALEITENLSNLLPYELKEWLKSGALHRSQMPGGVELICLNSLLARLRNRQTK